MIKIVIEGVIFVLGILGIINAIKINDAMIFGYGLFLLWALTFFEVMEIKYKRK